MIQVRRADETGGEVQAARLDVRDKRVDGGLSMLFGQQIEMKRQNISRLRMHLDLPIG